MSWNKKQLILVPKQDVSWLAGGAGPACFDPYSLDTSGNIDIYLSGRNSENKSTIGRFNYNLNTLQLNSIDLTPVVTPGERGLFDDSGTSYPHLVKINGIKHLYYTGWFLGKDTPFLNDPGLAIERNGRFEKYQRCTFLPRIDSDAFGVGSLQVFPDDDGVYKVYYTSFEKWGRDEKDFKHYYHIKYATSLDGIIWERSNHVAINFDLSKGEYVTAKPSIVKYKGVYFMWYSYRGNSYRIGVAVSSDSKYWQRMDHLVDMDVAPEGWDSEMICYANVAILNNHLYMLYNGNGFGKDGLGLVSRDLSYLDQILEEYQKTKP